MAWGAGRSGAPTLDEMSARNDVMKWIDEYRALHGCNPEVVPLSSLQWRLFAAYGQRCGVPGFDPHQHKMHADGVELVCFTKPTHQREINL